MFYSCSNGMCLSFYLVTACPWAFSPERAEPINPKVLFFPDPPSANPTKSIPIRYTFVLQFIHYVLYSYRFTPLIAKNSHGFIKVYLYSQNE